MIAPSPAQLLAAVLRVVAPGKVVTIHYPAAVRLGASQVFDIETDLWFRPETKDDLARVVAMLTPEQRRAFDYALDHPEYGYPTPSHILTLPPKTILAALVAATGAQV